MGIRLGLAQPERGAPHDHLDLVVDPGGDEAVDRQGARHPVDDGEHVRAEVLLQLGVLVQVVQHDLGDRVALEHDHEALPGAAGGLVADVGDAGDPAVLDQLGDLQREVVRVHLVRQLGDDQAGAALQLLDVDDRAHGDRPAAGAVGILDALEAQDARAGGEVRSLDAVDERLDELFLGRFRVRQVPQGALADLAEVVRRDVGGHADGDADGAVDQQVREPARQHERLLGAAVVVVLEVDGVLVDVAHHLERERRHLGLGVPRGGGAVVARGAEVALPERQRVAKAPGLHEAHERVVDGRVAVRVELPHHLADDAGALGERLVRAVAAVEHRVDHPAVHGLQAVAHFGQRTPDDDAHRVVEVGTLHLQLEVYLLDLVVRVVDLRPSDVVRRDLRVVCFVSHQFSVLSCRCVRACVPVIELVVPVIEPVVHSR